MDFPKRSYLILEPEYDNFFTDRFTGDYSVEKGFSTQIIIGSLLSYKKINKNGIIYFFLGDFFDPDHPQKSNDEVIESLSTSSSSFEEIIENTYSLFGKWVIIEDCDTNLRLMGDPHCTKSIKYYNSGIIISDLATLAAEIMNDTSAFNLSKDSTHLDFVSLDFQKTCWWCGNVTLFSNTFSLLPNHMLVCDKKTKNVKANHFFPGKNRECHVQEKQNLGYCYSRTMDLLVGFFKSLSYRSPFALTVTGGHDSRLLFAACHHSGIDAHCFISIHGSKNCNSPDVQIPQTLLKKLDFPFHIYKTEPQKNIVELIQRFFPEIPANKYASYNYASNFNTIPQSSRIVLGLIPEVISGYYYNRLFYLSGKGLSDIARHGGSFFSEQKFTEWLEETRSVDLPDGYTILDLFYWEHRAGRWAAQTVNVCDLFEDLIWGFNCREFNDIWMKTNIEERAWPKRENLEKLTELFGNQYLSIPYVKPETILKKIAYMLEKRKMQTLFRQLDYLYKRSIRKRIL